MDSWLTYSKFSLVPNSHLLILPAITWCLNRKDVSGFQTWQPISPQDGHIPLLSLLYTHTHTHTHTHTPTYTHRDTHNEEVWACSAEISVVCSPVDCPKLPYGTCWFQLTHNLKLWKRGPYWHGQWQENLSLWIHLSSEPLKVGQPHNTLFSWLSAIKRAGKREVPEHRFLVSEC